ncbi:MAG TPA: hypothetical protein VLD19_03515, partial [Chitinophagaceae bacterium]|nr:hypothetical protein [Chitinophagaceae bacterium]
MKQVFAVAVFYWMVGFCTGQVNLSTGATKFTLPLYSYTDQANRIGLNTFLSYTAGNGVKVGEVGTSVGTGWALNCGGVIERVQAGEPDDQKQTIAYTYPATTDQQWYSYAENYFPNGYLYSEYDPATAVANLGAYSPYTEYLPYRYIINGNGQTVKEMPYKPAPQFLADREQDVFIFSFNGYYGKFLIGKNKQVQPLENSRLKFQFTETDMSGSSIRTTISNFTITDDAGIQYIFSDMELANVCAYDQVDLYNKTDGTYVNRSANGVQSGYINVLKGRPLNQYVATKWFLSEIKNPLTGKSVKLHYDTYEVDFNADKIANLSGGGSQQSLVVLWQRNKAIRKKLVSIDMSDAERLEFQYYNQPRQDVAQEVFLQKLSIKYNNSEVYNWSFNFQYYTYQSGSPGWVLKNIDDP